MAIPVLLAPTIAFVDAGTSQAALRTPVLTDPTSETRLSIIPAPRGLIVDRYGEVMAGNRSYVRALLKLATVGGEAAAVALATERTGILSTTGFPAIQPPIFKPIVALAALEGQARRGTSSHYQCGPVFAVEGRDFHNWNDHEYGMYDLHTALLRSCNTWFYQAALDTGGTPILATARAFGLGRKPVFDLDGVSAGALPQSGISGQGLANFAIGQGDLLVSPLQMAMVMSGFANRSFVAKPRVILQVQTPETDAAVLQITPIDRSDQLHYPPGHLDQVRAGMRSVVNAARGTGRAAQLNWPQVYGKTGTAQWRNNGRDCTLAWFTGFVDASTPTLAFAVVSEGALDESISGGEHAAPMAGEWLRRVYANPDTYHVSPTGAVAESAPRKERTKSRAKPSTPVAQSPAPLRAQIIIPKTSSVGNSARIRPLDRFVKAIRP